MKSCRLSIKDHCVLFRRMFYIDTLNVPSIFNNVIYMYIATPLISNGIFGEPWRE